MGSGSSKWWKSLTPRQKKQYIRNHPNSIYARNGGGIFKRAAGAMARNPVKTAAAAAGAYLYGASKLAANGLHHPGSSAGGNATRYFDI